MTGMDDPLVPNGSDGIADESILQTPVCSGAVSASISSVPMVPTSVGWFHWQANMLRP